MCIRDRLTVRQIDRRASGVGRVSFRCEARVEIPSDRPRSSEDLGQSVLDDGGIFVLAESICDRACPNSDHDHLSSYRVHLSGFQHHFDRPAPCPHSRHDVWPQGKDGVQVYGAFVALLFSRSALPRVIRELGCDLALGQLPSLGPSHHSMPSRMAHGAQPRFGPLFRFGVAEDGDGRPVVLLRTFGRTASSTRMCPVDTSVVLEAELAQRRLRRQIEHVAASSADLRRRMTTARRRLESDQHVGMSALIATDVTSRLESVEDEGPPTRTNTATPWVDIPAHHTQGILHTPSGQQRPGEARGIPIDRHSTTSLSPTTMPAARCHVSDNKIYTGCRRGRRTVGGS